MTSHQKSKMNDGSPTNGFNALKTDSGIFQKRPIRFIFAGPFLKTARD